MSQLKELPTKILPSRRINQNNLSYRTPFNAYTNKAELDVCGSKDCQMNSVPHGQPTNCHYVDVSAQCRWPQDTKKPLNTS